MNDMGSIIAIGALVLGAALVIYTEVDGRRKRKAREREDLEEKLATPYIVTRGWRELEKGSQGEYDVREANLDKAILQFLEEVIRLRSLVEGEHYDNAWVRLSKEGLDEPLLNDEFGWRGEVYV